MTKAPANTNVETTNEELTAPRTEAEGIGLDRVRRATGTSDPSLQQKLVIEALGGAGLRRAGANEDAMRAAIAALESIGPRDGLEGLLATQMIATHEAAMDCLRRASIPNQTVVGQELNLKHAEKLMQLYVRQVEAIDKHRGKGQQKITVEHVTVQAGGRAIVGNVQAPSGALAAPRIRPQLSGQHATDTSQLELLAGSTEPAKAVTRRRGS